MIPRDGSSLAAKSVVAEVRRCSRCDQASQTIDVGDQRFLCATCLIVLANYLDTMAGETRTITTGDWKPDIDTPAT
jgi:hypothetical protein